MSLKLILLCTLMVTGLTYSQENTRNGPYLFATGGLYSSSYEQFDISKEHKIGFSPKIGFGVPLNNAMSLVVSWAYISRRDVNSSIKIFEHTDTRFAQTGTTQYLQRVFTLGADYRFELLSNTAAYLNLGFLRSSVQLNQIGEWNLSYTIPKKVNGFHTGMTIEHQLESMPASLIIDTQYLSLVDNKDWPYGQFGGWGIYLGAKYRLS